MSEQVSKGGFIRGIGEGLDYGDSLRDALKASGKSRSQRLGIKYGLHSRAIYGTALGVSGASIASQALKDKKKATARERVGKVLKPGPRYGSYGDWARKASGTGTGSGLGVGPKALERAKTLAYSPRTVEPNKRRAFNIWQRDNNKLGHWMGDSRDGKHVTAFEARLESGHFARNQRHQRRLSVVEGRRKKGLPTSDPKSRPGMVVRDAYEPTVDWSRRIRKGAYNIPASHLSRGGRTGRRVLQATGKKIDEGLRARVGAAPGAPRPRKVWNLDDHVGKNHTIEYREGKRKNAERTTRRGVLAATAGGTAAGSAAYVGHGNAGKQLKNIKAGANALINDSRVTKLPVSTKFRLARQVLDTNRHGAVLGAGAALGAVGVAGATQGRSRQAYHQHKINQRRRFNARKEPEVAKAFQARYGNASSVGRRETVEKSFASGAAGAYHDMTRGAINAKQYGSRYAAHAERANRPAGIKRITDSGRPALPSRKNLEWQTKYGPNRVSKRVRNKDGEDDRQRRLGMIQAGTAGGATYAGAKGIQDVLRSTKDVRATSLNSNTAIKLSPAAQKLFQRRQGVVLSRKGGALLAGSALLGAGALRTASYASGERNRRWE